MRTFKIYGNDTGETKELNAMPYLLHSIKNLGIKFNYEYLFNQNRQIQIGKDLQYQPIGGTLLTDSYSNYEIFRKFLVRNSSFKFYYSPIRDIERYIICNFDILSKAELNKYSKLSCDFTITPKSLWLEDIEINTEILKDDTYGKLFRETELSDEWSYGVKYNTTGLSDEWAYGYTCSSEINGTAELINDGDVETPLQTTLFGAITNPVINLFDVNDNLLQQASFTLTVGSGEKLVIDSNVENMKIVLVNTENQELDKTDTQDYTKKTYLTLPVGSYKMTISDSNLTPVSGTVKYQSNYIGA